MPANSRLTLTARNYNRLEIGKSLADFSDYSDCVEYVDQVDCGDYTEGQWYYIPEESLPDGSRVIYFGSFGNYNSPGASEYTEAAIYDADDPQYAEEVAYWEAREEFLPVDERWEVIVGNIGTVYSGTSEADARNAYDEYVEQSGSGEGRAGNEDVALLLDGNIELEHTPESEEDDTVPEFDAESYSGTANDQ